MVKDSMPYGLAPFAKPRWLVKSANGEIRRLLPKINDDLCKEQAAKQFPLEIKDAIKIHTKTAQESHDQ